MPSDSTRLCSALTTAGTAQDARAVGQRSETGAANGLLFNFEKRRPQKILAEKARSRSG